MEYQKSSLYLYSTHKYVENYIMTCLTLLLNLVVQEIDILLDTNTS